MKLAGQQPMIHPILHNEFHQNRSMGTSKTAGWSVISIFLPDPLKEKKNQEKNLVNSNLVFFHMDGPIIYFTKYLWRIANIWIGKSVGNPCGAS